MKSRVVLVAVLVGAGSGLAATPSQPAAKQSPEQPATPTRARDGLKKPMPPMIPVQQDFPLPPPVVVRVTNSPTGVTAVNPVWAPVQP